jgi:FMN reductase (NADPH)
MKSPVLDCLLQHRSIRRFKPAPVEPAKLDLILQAGTRAANTRNLQAYSFLIVDQAKLEELGRRNVPLGIITLVDQYRIKRWLELNDAPFHYDHLQFFLLSYWDAILALQNVIIAAESMGLGTVCLNTGLLIDVWEQFNCPEYTFPAGLTLLGYPDQSPERKPRLPLEAVVHHNQYQIPTDDELRGWFASHNAKFERYDEERKKTLRESGVTNHAQDHAVARVHAERAEKESARILENIRKAGFKI